ncbi:gustatory receptor for bitter taste 93a [Drosophila novamexicana]|uniref:gustatory receptor for bitter taste 93a n=1 Tax=Drosophila novamexicana TaxID=47314 RepID=UPI0011E5EE05|nr:gustatory receptor for bitter taste 93a [Drosophila novamexicana]
MEPQLQQQQQQQQHHGWGQACSMQLLHQQLYSSTGPLKLVPCQRAGHGTTSTDIFSPCLAMTKHKPQAAAVGRVELSSRRLLLALYQAARGLSLLSSSLDLEREPVQLKAPRQQCNRLLIILWRAILVNIYWTMIPSMFRSVKSSQSYAALIAMMQSGSVTVFAVGSFIMQVRAESRFMAILNRYIALYGHICALTRTQQLLPLKFTVFTALKLLLTLAGCLYEVPQLLPLEHIIHLEIGQVIGGLIAIYLWLGTLFLLDACFLGFFVSGLLYEHMGAHIATMLRQMRSIDIDGQELQSDDESESEYESYSHVPLSHYKRMCLLCDRADELEACGVIYNELYNVTLSFRSIFQWQILFYIYYNFIVLLLMLYEYILNYLEAAQGELVPILMVCIKMANIVLLIMCADFTIKKSQMPQILPLDIVCTDIDQRWDKSVESFLNQLQTQQLEIKVLGILQLNNGFIPTILSAIIAYLFILIQFAFTGGFEVADELPESIKQS